MGARRYLSDSVSGKTTTDEGRLHCPGRAKQWDTVVFYCLTVTASGLGRRVKTKAMVPRDAGLRLAGNKLSSLRRGIFALYIRHGPQTVDAGTQSISRLCLRMSDGLSFGGLEINGWRVSRRWQVQLDDCKILSGDC